MSTSYGLKFNFMKLGSGGCGKYPKLGLKNNPLLLDVRAVVDVFLCKCNSTGL